MRRLYVMMEEEDIWKYKKENIWKNRKRFCSKRRIKKMVITGEEVIRGDERRG